MKKIITVIFILALLILISSCQQQNSITQEEAKTFCDKIETMYNKADSEAAKEILDSSYVLYSPLFPVGLKGIEVLMYNIESNARSFPDFKLKIDSFFVKGDKIYSYWTQEGTNSGPLGRMPSTGKSIKNSGFAISRIKEGKIVEEHTYWNVLEFYRQLGFQVIPPSEQGDSE